jgi:antitoxin Phd
MRKPVKWQLQDAKNRFSALVEAAARSGPQVVTRRGLDAAVVVSSADYQKLLARRRGKSLVDVLLSAPKIPGGLRVERSRDAGREVDLE